MRYAFIEAHRPMWRLVVMCRVLRVSKAGYWAWRHRPESQRTQEERALRVHVAAIHRENREVYGSPRVHQELRAQGLLVGRKRVARLMREIGISAAPTPRCVRTTDSNHALPVADNLLAQDFSAPGPDTRWAADITYIPTDEGFLYLAAVEDLFSRRIVGYAMDATMDRSLVLRALGMALESRTPQPGLIHHSDRGSQYASRDHRQLLERHGIAISMSRRGNCYDNAMVESFWRSLKVELVYRQRFSTRDEALRAIAAYIETFYNTVRRHSALGYRSPAAFEAANRAGMGAA